MSTGAVSVRTRLGPSGRPGLPWPLFASPEEARGVAWAAIAGGLAWIGIGVAAHVVALVVVGALAASVLTAVVAPEVILALFLVVGGVRAAPWLASVPVNLTLVTWLGTIVAVVLHGLRPGRGVPRFPAPMLLAALLAVLVLLSDLWAVDPSAGLGKALKFEFVTMTALAAPLVLVRTRASLWRVAAAFVAFGLLIALTTVTTTNIGEPLAAAGGNEIQAGLYPGLAAIVLAAYLVPLARGLGRVLLALPLVILVPTVVAAGSRGALVSTIVAGVYLVGRAFMRSARKPLALLLVVLGIAGVATAAPTLAGGAASRYEQSLLTTNLSRLLGDRRELMGTGVTLALDHPLAGIGVGGFATARFAYEPQLYPHNILIELGAEQGLTAPAIFVLLAFAAWWARGRVASGVRGPEATLSGALILLLVCEAMVSFDINGNRLMWFALGLAFALARMRTPESLDARVSGRG